MRTIDADVLKEAFEADGYLSPYMERMIDACPTVNTNTIDDLKRALVEVRELCKHTKCVACPLHKTEEGSSIPYCPLYEDEYGMAVQFPNMWDIDDWMEDDDETD